MRAPQGPIKSRRNSMSDEPPIIPASITIVPNLLKEGSGSISLSSPAGGESLATASYSLDTSWRVLGFLDVDLESSWNVGEGSLRWYRIEGECGSVTCDEFGVEHRNCNRMTFVTTVAAASLPDLCDILRNPQVNAPVTTRISSISRYARPVFRDQIQPDQCNTLTEVEFCQIPECFDFCVEDDSSFLELADVEPESLLESLSEGSPEAELSPPSISISSCGCPNLGGSISLKHNLSRSPLIARYSEASDSVLPGDFAMAYRFRDDSWSKTAHMRRGGESLLVSWGLKCESDLLNLSLSVRLGARATRLSLGIPGEIACSPRLSSSDVQVYFRKPARAPATRIRVSTSSRTEPRVVIGAAEAFANGIFVPVILYYDELGVFDDPAWGSSPLRIYLDSASRSNAKTMSLSGYV